MSIQKKEYEISVWIEELNEEGIKVESKGMIIGAHDMTHLGKATGVKLRREVKGTNTLTFQMPEKYFDSELGKFVKNELIEELYNERKIKLKYKDKWYEFYIKNVKEDKRFKSKMKSFTCTDSFIDELSRTGYEIEFNSELNNSVEESGIFTEEILEKSVWDYQPKFNIGDFTEFNEERFYKIPLSQFGGKIIGYPINLDVLESDLNSESDYCKKRMEEEGISDFKDFNVKEEITIKNIYKNTERRLQYGDDLARVEELFWDSYYKDNGRELLNDSNLVTIESDYIYVPITDLSFIMGSIYNNSYKALEEPALYGKFNSNYPNGEHGYALQPTSNNPTDLIQFICFQNDDEFLIDEAGVLANNNCHYVIKVGQWNQLLKDILEPATPNLNDDSDHGLIFWTSPAHKNDSTYSLTTKYNVLFNDEIAYSTNVRPTTRTIDDFQWYPVYYEGYLNEINNTPVSMARNISITDRTELNKEEDTYVTVYKQKDSDFQGLYSEDELNELIIKREQLLNKEGRTPDEERELKRINEDFRVCSKLASRIILPSLARNIADNGTNITDVIGWESKTQNMNNSPLGTGSYSKLLEVKIQSTIKNKSTNDDITIEDLELDGTIEDENISDYYLEILSPYIEQSGDFSLEGKTQTDYALNFGFIGQEKKIEKDKVYAIRLKTGNWIVDNYEITYRGTKAEKEEDAETQKTYTEKDYQDYKSSLLDFKNVINSLPNNLQEGDYSELSQLFCSLIIPNDNDKLKEEKQNYINESLLSIIEGGKVTIFTKENNRETTQNGEEIEVINITSQIDVLPQNSLIGIHDSKTKNNVSKWINILKLPVIQEGQSLNEQYNNSDVQYLKYLLLQKFGKTNSASGTTGSFYLVSQLTKGVIDEWINTYTIKNQHFEKYNNVDLSKVVIGEGSVNLSGNYIIDGIDSVGENANYISFAELADLSSNTNLVFLPEELEGNDANFLTQPLYYTRSEEDDVNDYDNRWHWETKKPNSKYYVEDNAFLLFKAKKTIENPYIAIKTDSSPAAIDWKNVQENNYQRNDGTGVKIEVITPYGEITVDMTRLIQEQYYYIDDILVETYLIDSNNFSQEFLSSINFNSESGTIGLNSDTNTNERKYGELKEGDLLANYSDWSAQSSIEKPLYYSAMGLWQANSTKSYGYALFINKIYYGVFWVELKNSN